MPPKKQDIPEIKPLIGRPGTSLKIGIVGVPNVRKCLHRRRQILILSIKLFRSANPLSSTFSPNRLHQLRIFLSAPSIRAMPVLQCPMLVSTISANTTSQRGE
jgi:hypothetical protein